MYRLAYFLLENGIEVSVVNPLKIKRFIQMELSKIKTDKSDSKMIQLYAKERRTKAYGMDNLKHNRKVLQLSRLLSLYTKQRTQIKNKLAW